MFEPEELMARIVDLEEQLKVSEMAPPAAEQLIACLEGEIAKRDETIARLEPQLNRAIQANYDLREELAALKAQEPVAWAGAIEYGVPLLMVEPQNWKATPLYAAPAADACKACKGTRRRPIGGRGRIFGLTNRCFECQPLTDEEVYGQVTADDQ